MLVSFVGPGMRASPGAGGKLLGYFCHEYFPLKLIDQFVVVLSLIVLSSRVVADTM